MNHATRRMRYLAKRIFTHEASERKTLSTESQLSVRVIQKLRPQLEDLMGNTGFHALVSRSLALAKEEAPWLAGARLNTEGILEGFENPDDPANPKRISTSGSVHLAWMLELLSSFIGELHTMQMVIGVWPKLPLDGYFSEGNDHEKNL